MNTHTTIVIGAGLSGLTAARELKKQGQNVLVLEAKARPGGRLFNQHTAGGVVDGGGSWVGPQHTALLSLLDELGISTWKQHTDGKNILVWNGKRRDFNGEIPPFSLWGIARMFIAARLLNRMAQRLRGETPWLYKEARAWDAVTFQQWLDTHVNHPQARFLLELAVITSFASRTEDISLYAVLVHIASAGSFENLTGIKNAALDAHITGGSGGICEKLAAGLTVTYNSPVTRIEQLADLVTVTTPTDNYSAQQVILALDPASAAAIHFTPGLPARRQQLQQQYTMGNGIKVHFVYANAFWREAGYSGQSYTNEGLLRLTFDVSPTPNSAILVGFMGAPLCDDPTLLLPGAFERRRQAALIHLATRFGDQALSPLEYIEQDWSQEPYHTGCLPCTGPGVMTNAQDAFTKPVGRIHFAGSESSHIWEGHMEGAVQAGLRAAAEVQG